MLGRSLQLVGLGLYEKFLKANTLLEEWMTSSEDGPLVLEEAVSDTSLYRPLQDTVIRLDLAGIFIWHYCQNIRLQNTASN